MITTGFAKVERRKQSGVSGVNEPNLSWVAVIQTLPCDIQPDMSAVIMPSQGQTTIIRKIMFCKKVDIRERDRITDSLTNLQYFVTEVRPYGILRHLEVKMEYGVL